MFVSCHIDHSAKPPRVLAIAEEGDKRTEYTADDEGNAVGRAHPELVRAVPGHGRRQPVARVLQSPVLEGERTTPSLEVAGTLGELLVGLVPGRLPRGLRPEEGPDHEDPQRQVLREKVDIGRDGR